jgi:nucleoside-diphosphate-sugar epimerase
VNEVLDSVSDALGRWIDPVSTPMRARGVRHTRAAKGLLGWEPHSDWTEAVAATVRWFIERRRGS